MSIYFLLLTLRRSQRTRTIFSYFIGKRQLQNYHLVVKSVWCMSEFVLPVLLITKDKLEYLFNFTEKY